MWQKRLCGSSKPCPQEVLELLFPFLEMYIHHVNMPWLADDQIPASQPPDIGESPAKIGRTTNLTYIRPQMHT